MPCGRACACLPTRIPSTSRPPKPLGKGGDLLPRSFRHEAALRQRVSQREASEQEQDDGSGSPRKRTWATAVPAGSTVA